MRVAFIGHAWHQKTGSSRFLIALLEQHATVDLWSGEPDDAATKYLAANFDEDRYDVIVIWQLHEAFSRLSGRHPNVVFIPMYDAMLWGGEFYWKRAFNSAKIVAFSWKLRQELMRLGSVHAGFQYYPDPALHTPVEDFSTLRGFFWYRRRAISPEVVFNLSAGTSFERFTIHDAPDPDNEATGTWLAPPNIRGFERTGWSETRDAYDTALSQSNVYFAPRLFEGIGMSSLEAMASGHCVAAPNAPTMNEYIAHGTNGLLYIPGVSRRLDFSNARSIGARARESIERGHERWLTSIPALLEFLLTPAGQLRGGPIIPVRNQFASAPDALVSVVTICRDAGAMLRATMESVLGQTGCEFEYVVIDRGSTDGSAGIIRGHAGQLAAWRIVTADDPDNAIKAALELVRGTWVLFIDAGDTFSSGDALRRMFSKVPIDAHVVYGHHIERHDDGTEQPRHAAEFETTWSRLQAGDLGWDWLSGIPGRTTTAIRRELLVDQGLDARLGTASALDLLLRARIQSARFFNCDEVIAIHGPEGLATDRRSIAVVARAHGDAAAVDRFFAQPGVTAGAPVSMTIVARLGRLALHLITVLDRRAPAAARLADRLARGPAARWLVRRLLPKKPG